MRRHRLAAVVAAGMAVVAAAGAASPAVGRKTGSCSPLDLALVIDNTGTMGGAIDDLKRGFDGIVGEAKTVSAGRVRYALVTFPEDNVVVNQPFTSSESAARTAVDGIALGGGDNIPESSDEAMDTVVNTLTARDRAPGRQIGDFLPGFRRRAEKIAVLVTDARPGGFDDEYGPADVANVRRVADAARSKGIRITAVNVGGADPEPDPGLIAIMRDGWARRTGGVYRATTFDGVGTAAAIRESIARCGGLKKMRVRARPRSLGVGEPGCVNFRVRGASGRPVSGARVRFGGVLRRTNRRGLARFCVRFSRAGCRRVRAARHGYRPAGTRVCGLSGRTSR